MAVLKTETGETSKDLNVIQKMLEEISVQLAHWPLPESAEVVELLAADSLSDTEKERVLKACDIYFRPLQEKEGYQSRDLIVLHPQVPGLNDLLKKFDRCHTHDDDEVRYIVDGRGIFGFVLSDGRQVTLEVEAGEYIRIPKDTEHWFLLSADRRIKAVRYFSGTEGWVPKYTETAARL